MKLTAVKNCRVKGLKEKKLSEVLTPEQIKAMHTYYEEMGKNMPRKVGN
jgi:hypothetical protein